MRMEHEFILQAIGNAIAPCRKKRLFRENLNWRYLFSTAVYHGVLPLLYRGVKAGDCPLPPTAFTQLHAMFYNNAGKALLLTRKMFAILELLEQHAIATIPFKGVVLASQLYGDVAFRQCGDLDFLVQKCDALKAKRVLIGHGYRPQFKFPKAIELALLHSECETMFSDASGKTFVDLHWAIFPRFYSVRLDIKCMWRRIHYEHLQNNKIRSLSSEDMALLLCVHASKHCWQRLLWISDMACLLTAGQTNWQAVCYQAKKAGMLRMVNVGALLAQNLFAVDLPKSFSIRYDNEAKSIVQLVREDIFSKESNWNSTIFQLRIKECAQDRFRYCARSLISLNQADYSYVSLPQWLLPFYYPVRWLRLLWKHGRSFWKDILNIWVCLSIWKNYMERISDKKK